jgi:hypothetical protein
VTGYADTIREEQWEEIAWIMSLKLLASAVGYGRSSWCLLQREKRNENMGVN